MFQLSNWCDLIICCAIYVHFLLLCLTLSHFKKVVFELVMFALDISNKSWSACGPLVLIQYCPK